MNHAVDMKIARLGGFDSAGEAFVHNGRILRGIYRGHGDQIRAVLGNCQKNNLFDNGIVATWISPSNPLPDLDYELWLAHEKVPFISYPHEWSTAMLQAAALFHIDLYEKLAPCFLTIKDWHPLNILFNATEPVLVDFTSIIPMDKLQSEAYLTPPTIPALFKSIWNSSSAYFYEMYRRMCVPYFLLPLYLMHQKRYKQARKRMFETTLNASKSVIQKNEVFPIPDPARFVYEFKMNLKRLRLSEKQQFKEKFLRSLRKEILSLDVSTIQSSYTNYYEAKNADFSFEPSANWKKKQKVVYETIQRLSPETMLDISCNTGWFSVMAAKQGCRVLAFDIDEACVNVLYQQAKSENLDILPLVANLTELTPTVFPTKMPCNGAKRVYGSEVPILLSAEQRFKCDLVLALAIIHHLVLGSGQTFEEIIRILSAMANKCLVVEFVAKEDRLIAAETDFFQEYYRAPNSFDWYNLDDFTNALRVHFNKVEIQESSSKSRFILICER